MLDSAGYLAEATVANVFVVKEGALLTPWPKACLAGITRAEVMKLARAADLDVAERDLTPTELLNADEAFLTGTGAEIKPVVEVNGQPIGAGVSGAVTLELQERYRALVRAEGVPIA